MSTPLQPTILEAGLNALWLASNDGLAARITHIALGDAAYTPEQSQTGLRSERVRYPIADGRRVSSRQIHITALADGPSEFWVREVGFVLENGQMLAVWSHPSMILAYKATSVDLLLAYDLDLAALPADSVTVVSTGAGLNLALAEEIAALAGAQVSGMLRDLQHRYRFAAVEGRASSLERAHDYLHNGLDAHRKRIDQVANRNTRQTELLAVLATSLIDTQRRQIATLTTV